MLRELLEITGYIARNLPDSQSRDLISEIRRKEPNAFLEEKNTSLWEQFIEKIGKVSAFTKGYLSEATGEFYPKNLIITFNPGEEDRALLVDNARNRALFQKVSAELGLGDNYEIVIKPSPRTGKK
jgi:hypothetical protein